MISALPAFVVGAISVKALAHLGISEVWSFVILMPFLIFAWFYFVGWLIERLLRNRRSHLPG
jgi:hypothetical protein